jgi:hypothetical protein
LEVIFLEPRAVHIAGVIEPAWITGEWFERACDRNAGEKLRGVVNAGTLRKNISGQHQNAQQNN